MKMNHISIVETDNQLRQIEVTHHAGFMILPILLPRLRSDSTAPLLLLEMPNIEMFMRILQARPA